MPQSPDKNPQFLKEPGTFSPERLARMQAAMRCYIDSGWAPGLVAYVYHRGREHVDVAGTMAFGSNEPMRRDTIFRLASMTKPVTAVGAMILLEECRLRLDDPVDEWLPELKDRQVLRTIESPLDDTVPATRPLTLRDLLTFRSGYGEVGFLSPGSPLQRAMSEAGLTLADWPFTVTPDEYLQRLGKLPLAHQPGERWLYHTAFEILGVLIARVSGTSLGAFLRERIFEPLGMADTGFFVVPDRLDRLPACYGRAFPMAPHYRMQGATSGELVVLHEARGGHYAKPPIFESGGGGLVSTVADMAAFGLMLLNRGTYGRARILSRLSVELMTMDHLTREQKALSPFFEKFWDIRSWGLGIGVTTARHDLGCGPGCFGWDGAFGTSWYVDPKEQLLGILMIQRRPDALSLPPITQDFWTSAYQLIDD
jgi:CubicO group peptidase (beta-lactamase class C family)